MTMNDILIATLGRSPRTVTETAGELVRRGAPLSEILMIRTQGSEPVPEEVRQRLLPADRWREIVIPAADVLTPEDARAMARTIFETVEEQKQRSDVRRLHLDLTGGRKTMSAYLFLAAQFFLDAHDRVYHTEVDQNVFTGDKWYPERDGEVSLLEAPFVRMRELMRTFMDSDLIDPFDTVAAAVEQLQRHVVLGLMARGVEHEVNNDLNILLRNLEKLEHRADLKPVAQTIRARAENIEGVTRSLLAMVETPAQRIRRDASLRDIIQGAVNDAGERFDMACTVTGRDAVVRIDPLLLRRVFRIVLQNAVQASGHNVSIEMKQAGERVEVLIADDGEGMTQEIIEDAFRPVKRRPSTGRRGIGLVVARRIVEGYGGTITLDSAPGQGARVRMSLPAARKDKA